MSKKRNASWLLNVCGFVALVAATGCDLQFQSVNQPAITQTNTTVAVSVTANYENSSGSAFTFYFGVKLPVGWTVVGDAVPFSGGVNGTNVYNATISAQMEALDPAGVGYYWWVGTNVAQSSAAGGVTAAFFLHAGAQSGLFNLDYMLGDNNWSLNSRRSNGHPIGINVSQVTFTASPSNGIMPLAVAFSASGIGSDGKTITGWNWDFGDGSRSALQNPSHTYTNDGTFTPYLVASNELGWVVIGSGPGITASLLPDYQYVIDGDRIIITAYVGSDEVVAIPSTIGAFPVTEVEMQAFSFNPSVASVTIPASITNIGLFALAYCQALTNIEVDVSNTVYSSVNGVLFDEAHTTLLQYPGGRVGGYSIEEGVTDIGYGAFAYSFGLTSVMLPASVTNIGRVAFAICTVLTNFDVAAANTAYCSSNGIVFNKAQTLLVQYPCGRAGSYAFPDSVADINDGAFAYCSGLPGVTIPGSVTNIGALAFGGCAGLTNVSMAYGVMSIGNQAFSSCTGLVSVIIPGSVIRLEGNAFANCQNLVSAFFLGDMMPLEFSDLAFYGTPVTVYYLPTADGWDPTFFGCPTLLWNPEIHGGGFGATPSGFGFSVSGTEGIPIVVKACTNLTRGAWVSLQSTNLAGGSVHISDGDWKNFPARYYIIGIP